MNVIIHVDDKQIVISGVNMAKAMCLGASCFTTKVRDMSKSLSGAYHAVLSEILKNKDIHLDGNFLKTTGVGMALLYKAFNQEIEGFDEKYDCARHLAYKDLMTGNGINDRYRNLPNTDRVGYVVEDLIRQLYVVENFRASQQRKFSDYRAVVEPSIRFLLDYLLREQPSLPESKFRYSDWASIRVWYFAVLTHVYLALLSSSSESHLEWRDATPCVDVADFWDDILEVTAVDDKQYEFLRTAIL